MRGYVSAYDADTGKLAWRFYTVPGDPSKPFESPALEKAAKTWNGEWWKIGGGGTASASGGFALNIPPLSFSFLVTRPIRVAPGIEESGVLHFTLRYLYL